MSLRFFAALLLAASLALGVPGLVFAHGHISAGDYDLVIGFHDEPAVQGLPNSLDLFVTNTRTNEKINGLEDSLHAELIFGSSKKTLKLAPQEGQDGAYTTFVIPGAAGKYTWHITGKINDQAVDVSLSSGPDTFGEVEAQSSYIFPPGGASAEAGSAQTALVFGILGSLLGLAGLVVGFISLRRPVK